MRKRDESILVRCASNIAGRACRLPNMKGSQAMMWMAQLFIMADRGSDLNYIVRMSAPSMPKLSIVNAIRIGSGNAGLIREELRHGI